MSKLICNPKLEKMELEFIEVLIKGTIDFIGSLFGKGGK